MMEKNVKKKLAIVSVFILLFASSITVLAGAGSCTFDGGSGRLTVNRNTSTAISDANLGGVVYANMVSYTSDGRHLDTKNGSAAGSITVTYSGGGIGYASSTHYAQGYFSGRRSLKVYA